MADEKKKIIIDEDWKAQAQKEKEILKEQEKIEDKKDAQHPLLPPADFAGLVSVLATQAFYALGVIGPEDRKDEEIEPDWDMAKFNIDMLGMLEEKCKNNLTAEEAQLLKSTLGQLRMLFFKLSEG